jgi:trk system potassium uptake protein TrkA
MALARSLAEKGVEVLAVDRSEDNVRAAAPIVAEALVFDATDERALARISPERRDVCVVAIGDESRESSIICTALLRQMGAQRVVARATDPLHERILRLVGANDVVNPEQEFGERFATRLLYSGIIEEIPLGADLTISEIEAPPSFVGRTLLELALPARHSVTVVAIRRTDAGDVVLPRPDSKLAKGDILVLVAKRESVRALAERF